jgi:Zn finger protein HypA/HybF involved in hydrogenase expression
MTETTAEYNATSNSQANHTETVARCPRCRRPLGVVREWRGIRALFVGRAFALDLTPLFCPKCHDVTAVWQARGETIRQVIELRGEIEPLPPFMERGGTALAGELLPVVRCTGAGAGDVGE